MVIANDNDSETLSLLARHRPELVFISVELPDKKGFSLFTKVKKAQRNVPLVLTTSTVAKADMKLHEKLRIHATAYLDKRELTDEQLAAILEARGFSPPEASDSSDEVSASESNTEAGELDLDEPLDTEPTAERPERRDPDIDPTLTQFLDPETAAIFDEIDEEASEFLRPSKTKAGDVSPERLAELEELAERLEELLEQARSDGRSSPFSSEFVTLRETANRKEEEIVALKETIHRRDGYVLVVKRKLAELAQKLVAAQKDHEQSAEDATELKERLDSTQKKLEHIGAELDEQQRLHQREIESLKEGLSEEQVRLTVTRHELKGQLTELRAERTKFVQAGEESLQKALKELEKSLRTERATAIADLKEKYSEKLKEVDESHGRTLAEARAEHEKESAALHETHIEALERTAAETQEAMRDAAAKSAEALEQSNNQRVAELAQADQKRTADVEAVEKRHRAKLEALLEKHGAEREELEQKADAAVKANDNMLGEVNAKVQDVLKSWEKERQSHHQTRERYETDLAELQAEHTKHLDQTEQDQFSVLAGLSRKFRDERTKALEAERSRGELKLEELNHEYARALASRDKRHQEKTESLKMAHESALAEKDRAIEQQIADAIERATSSLTKEHEEVRQSHANQLASLRQSKEQDIASLQASHMEVLAKKDQEAQQALRDGVEQVKADTGDQIEQLQEANAHALAAHRKDYSEELETLEEVHRSAVSQHESAARTTLRSVEDERDQAGVVLDGVRAEMAEMAAKHRSTVSVLEEQHKSSSNISRTSQKPRFRSSKTRGNFSHPPSRR